MKPSFHAFFIALKFCALGCLRSWAYSFGGLWVLIPEKK
jgi:hypothetical protein